MLLSWWWRSWRGRGSGVEGVRRLAHEAHEGGLRRRELLSHERLGGSGGLRGRGLAVLALRLVGRVWTPSSRRAAAPVVASAVVVVVLVRVVVVVPAVAVSVPERRGVATVTVAIISAVAVEAAAPVFAGSTCAHASLCFLLVHEVGVVGVVATETHTSTASSSAPGVQELQEFGVDGLTRLLQHSHQVASLAQVSWGEEGVGCALVGAAGRSSDAVHVVLGGAGIVIVDDELDILHIQTT